jgi:putative Mg2+ transporter-C (MgtC) family protein
MVCDEPLDERSMRQDLPSSRPDARHGHGVMTSLWPLVGAVAAGAAIGLEREWRGSPAGLRTHMLVSLASALLMLAAVQQLAWLRDTPTDLIRIDPVRMAHGVLTGIGFLGAGVIFREGASIRGLTTAASLWITSALGMLFGVGFYGLGAAGTLAAVAVLGAVSLTELLVPQRRYLDLVVRFRATDAPRSDEFRHWLRGYGVVADSLEQHCAAGEKVHKLRLRCERGMRLEALAADLEKRTDVVSYSIIHTMR